MMYACERDFTRLMGSTRLMRNFSTYFGRTTGRPLIIARRLAILLSVVVIFSSSAVTLKNIHWDELCSKADRVIAATVRSLQFERTDSPHSGGVRTRMTLDDIVFLTGVQSRETVDVLLPGGQMDGREVLVPGAPCFKPGEQIVLFLRDAGDGQFALLGHGMGVLRRSEDGEWISPDIPVEGGPGPHGEGYDEFTWRLNASQPCLTLPADVSTDSMYRGRPARHLEQAPANSNHFCVTGSLLAALLGMIWAFWNRSRVALIFLGAAGLALALSCGIKTFAAPAANRTFVKLGQTWDLSADLRGRVHSGRVLWVRGRGTPDLPDEISFAAIQRMFLQWEDISESNIAFQQDGSTIESGHSVDERNVISFLEDVPKEAFDELTLAITFLISEPDTKFYKDMDIVFNDRDVIWLETEGGFSIETVAIHEIGHFIGLGHSTDPVDVMFPRAGGLRTLSSSDRDGAIALYPLPSQTVAVASAISGTGPAPLTVSFLSGESFSPGGSPLSTAWDFGDGTPVVTDPQPQHTYSSAGKYTAVLTVSDSISSSTASVPIFVGAAAGSAVIKSFSYQVALSAKKNGINSDRLSLLVGGVDLGSGDRLTIKLGSNQIGTITEGGSILPVVLDSRLSFKGTSNLGGQLGVRYNAKSKQLLIKQSGANFGVSLDPRDTASTAQSGTGHFPLVLLVGSSDGDTTAYSADISFSFKIKSGNTPFGFIENSIQARQ